MDKVTKEQASALADLQFHWDEAYAIAFDGSTWSARYQNSAGEMRAGTPEALRELIRVDYQKRRRAELAGLQERMST